MSHQVSNESGLRKGTRATSGHPLLWAVFIVVSFGSGSGKECWRPTVGCCRWCWQGVRPHSLGFPLTGLKFWQGGAFLSHMAPTLGSKALERAGVHPVGCAFLSIFSPLAILSLVSTCCSPHAVSSRCAVDWGDLSQTSLAVMGAGAARSALVHPSPPIASLLGLFGALAGLLSCPALVRMAINLAIWCPNSIVPSTGSVVMADLALTLSWATLFSLSTLWCGYDQLGISCPGVTIEIPNGISNMFADPVEETIFEVLLDL